MKNTFFIDDFIKPQNSYYNGVPINFQNLLDIRKIILSREFICYTIFGKTH